MIWLYFLIAILLTVFVHELGHMIMALLLGVKVKAFSIGFGKPYLHKTIKGIDYRLSPILLGGYTKLAGEYDKSISNGFLAQRYHKKAMILLAGVMMNFVLACICYILNYGSIKLGLQIDIALIIAMFSKNIQALVDILMVIKPNIFLLQLSIINLMSVIFNLIPFPALDGGTIWLLLLEKKIGNNFSNFLKLVSYYGFAMLMLLQAGFIYWLYLM